MAFLLGMVLAKGVFLLPFFFFFKEGTACYLLPSETASAINIAALTEKAFSQFAVLFSLSLEMLVLFP